jgi:hypothetical protein
MALEDTTLGRSIGLEAFDSHLVGAAEENPVSPRKHVEVLIIDPGVVDLRLRLEHGQLALDGHELGVAEQVASAKAGAIHYGRLGQRSDLRW